MTSLIHNTFSIEHNYPQPVERVFAAFLDPKKRRRWFAEGDGFIVDRYELDFQVGGFERCRYRYGDGPAMTLDGVYLDLAANQRIVLAYAMTVAGVPMSSSLATTELVSEGSRTLLRFTEHTVFVDGKDGSAGRREGSIGMLLALAQELETHG